MTNSKKQRQKRCVDCLEIASGSTKDHVFPDSWYPKSTSGTVQRWTVPSCSECNSILSPIENGLLIRIGLCLDPGLTATTGIGRTALRSIAIGDGVEDEISSEELAHRRAKKRQIAGQLLMPDEQVLKSVIPGFNLGQSSRLNCSCDQDLKRFSSAWVHKIVRGCGSKLANKRYVESPYAIYVNIPSPSGLQTLDSILASVPLGNSAPGLHFGEQHHRRSADRAIRFHNLGHFACRCIHPYCGQAPHKIHHSGGIKRFSNS